MALSLRPGHFVSGPAIPFGSSGAEQKLKRLIMYPANMEGGDEVSGHFLLQTVCSQNRELSVAINETYIP